MVVVFMHGLHTSVDIYLTFIHSMSTVLEWSIRTCTRNQSWD